MPKKKETTETTPAAKEPKKATTAAAKPAAATAAAKPAATKAAKPAAKPATTTAKTEKPAAAKPAATKAAKPAPTTAKTEKPAAASKPVTTVIIAKYDVGHGNSMHIRGDGHSLSWENGTVMENAGGDVWQWTTTEAREGVLAFKLLINDEVWSTGENMNAPFGETTTVYPTF